MTNTKRKHHIDVMFKREPVFPLGPIMVSQEVRTFMDHEVHGEDHELFVHQSIRRHAIGIWGDVSDSTREANTAGVDKGRNNHPLTSVHTRKNTYEMLKIVTTVREADGAICTIVSEYRG